MTHQNDTPTNNNNNNNNNNNGEGSRMEVYLRFRPMNKLEISRRSRSCVEFHSPDEHHGLTGLTVDSPLEGEFDFSFDKVFQEDAKQEEVYNTIHPQAKRLIDGYNSAIIAFGQSGSGKSNTMMGDNPFPQKNTGIPNKNKTKSIIKNNKNANINTKTMNNKNTTNTANGNVNNANNTTPMGRNTSIHENTGMIPRIAKQIFHLMNQASPTIEFTVRVSFIEIYLEQVRDLLNPSKRFLKINDGDEKSEYEKAKGPKLEGLSEVCCLEWEEVVTLLFRGNSFRVISEQRKQTDLNQSHSIFTIQIEQRNLTTDRTITSKMHLVDLAGSELDKQIPKRGKNHMKNSRSLAVSPVQDRERNLVNRSHMALNSVMRALERFHDPLNHQNHNALLNLPPNPDHIPYHESKLTRILWNALGGNCYTTFLLTASTATFNISATIATLRFGERCSNIKNYPYINIEASPEECNIELEKSRKIQSELLVLIKEVGTEMRRIKDKGVTNSLEDDGPLWDKLNKICESNKYFVLDDESAGGAVGMSFQDEMRRKNEEISVLQDKLAAARNDRDKAQTLMLEMEGECVFLRNESEEVLAAKKRNTEDIIDAQNEIQRLSQKKLELEHDLRTSQFRENEAITFTRLFRRFYRKLLQNNSAHGSGSTKDVFLRMAGVPDLDDLIDIDYLLCESGLIEDYEVNSNMDDKKYNPSVNSIVRSSALASKAKRQAKLQLSRPRTNTVDMTSHTSGSKQTISTKSHTFNESMSNVIIIPTIDQSASGEQTASTQQLKFPQTPAGKLTDKRIDVLEQDLLHITRRCIDLQMALNESEEWVELLTLSKTKKKVLEENSELRKQMEKKESDMRAMIWKMNEIHIINNTYNEKLSSREQHISYLEDKLLQLQDKDMMQTSRQEETERKLRAEITRVNTLLEAMTRVHWQDGKAGAKQRLESRIIIPFQGGSSLDPKVREGMLQGPPNVVRPPMSAAGTTLSGFDSRDGRTTAGISYAPSFGPSVASSVYIDRRNSHNASNDSLSHNNTLQKDVSRLEDGSPNTSRSQLETSKSSLNPLEENSPELQPPPDAVLAGGKSSYYDPRRTSNKKGLKVMPGILKSSAKTSKFINQMDRQQSLNDTRKKLDDLDLIWNEVS